MQYNKNRLDFALAVGLMPVQSASWNSAAVFATAVAGLVDEQAAQLRQLWLESCPDPNGQLLAGGILKSGYLIEVAMIEFIVDEAGRLFDIGEVHHPATALLDWSLYVHTNPERMAM